MSNDWQTSRYHVPKMDCGSEEQLVRGALRPLDDVGAVAVDLEERTVDVTHTGEVEPVTGALESLSFGAEHLETVSAEQPPEDERDESRVLKQLLAINGVMFVLELGLGLWAESTGLVADSLDMLADAMVYGFALAAVGVAARQKRAARASGVIQLILALMALGEVARRAIWGSEPVVIAMIGMGSLALVANTICLVLLAKRRDSGVHMKASWIFSTNDAIANTGVIIAGVLVWLTGSSIPDLVVGSIVGIVVLYGAIRILKL